MRVKSYNYLRASIEGYLESPFQSGPLSTVLGKTCDEGPIRLGLSYCAVAGPIINDYRLQPLGGKTRDDRTYRPLFVVRSHTDRNALLHRVSHVSSSHNWSFYRWHFLASVPFHDTFYAFSYAYRWFLVYGI